ncbi:MAG TPA: glycosyltransferase, partial [Flavihumibacter sp.]|nr:glycosyltransferase [Flavihumibacter sp.]
KGASDDVRLWLEQADAYAFTSYYSEGIPRSLMEAASMELPVVVPDLRGCRDLVKDGISGFVFSGSNQQQQNEALQQKMENILRLSADARNAMGAAGRALMQAQFDTSRVIVIYRETIAKSS